MTTITTITGRLDRFVPKDRPPPVVRGGSFICAFLASRAADWSLATQLVFPAFMVLLGAVWLVAAERRVYRDFGSIEKAISYRRALRTGQLPAVIEPAVWRGWLERSRKRTRLELCVAGFIFGWLVLKAYVHHPWALVDWAFGALFSLFAISGFVTGWLMRTRIPRLAMELERRPMSLSFARSERWIDSRQAA